MKTFKAQQTTSASQAEIWQIWQDVANWQQWDSELQSAHLEGPFVLGAKGLLKPKSGPQSHFVISELTAGQSFTFTVSLPLAKLSVAHYFLPGQQTVFVHDVVFSGPLAPLFGRLLGRTYAAALPGVLRRIRDLAEQVPAQV